MHNIMFVYGTFLSNKPLIIIYVYYQYVVECFLDLRSVIICCRRDVDQLVSTTANYHLIYSVLLPLTLT